MIFARKFSCLAVIAAAWLLSDTGSAKATFTLSLNGGLVATDGGAGDLDGLVDGSISFNGTYLGAKFTTLSDSFYDPISQEYVVTTTVQKISNGTLSAVSLTLTAEEDAAFFPSGLGNPTTVVGSMALNGGVGKGTLTAFNDSIIDGVNVLPGVGIAITSFTSPVNLVDPTAFNVQNKISLTIGANSSKTQLEGKTEVLPSVVPAPAGLLLAATAMPVFGLFGWMKRRKVAIA